MKVSKRDFLSLSGVPRQTLELWLEQSWIIPEQTAAGPRFSDRDVARARLIIELRDNFGANEPGIDLILHLMDQLHGMRWALSQLRKEMEERSASPTDDDAKP